jgi:hypothetical protein
MNKWLKVVVPSIVATLVVFFVLVASGLGTSSILNSEGATVTQTVLQLDVNVFAALMIAGVFLAVLISSYLLERTGKT